MEFLYLYLILINALGLVLMLADKRKAVKKAWRIPEATLMGIAVIGGPAGEKGRFCAPCGVCRQVLREFCTLDFRILLGTTDEVQSFTLGELLPVSFGPSDLKGE